jgi:hypothetical protein
MITTATLATALAFLRQAPGAAGRAEAAEMTPGGWVFMAAAWAFILTLVYYTFSKVLRGGK